MAHSVHAVCPLANGVGSTVQRRHRQLWVHVLKVPAERLAVKLFSESSTFGYTEKLRLTTIIFLVDSQHDLKSLIGSQFFYKDYFGCHSCKDASSKITRHVYLMRSIVVTSLFFVQAQRRFL